MFCISRNCHKPNLLLYDADCNYIFFKINSPPDYCLHCFLPAPNDKDLIAKLRVPRKFPAMVSIQKDSNHSQISVSCIIIIFLIWICILYIVYCASDCFFIFLCTCVYLLHRDSKNRTTTKVWHNFNKYWPKLVIFGRENLQRVSNIHSRTLRVMIKQSTSLG